ncbi:MAG: hypothetical protein M0Z53_09745 [Thermaerobacter sp.]|nr:hypothetical protein [Thermaerobacter sp.]
MRHLIADLKRRKDQAARNHPGDGNRPGDEPIKPSGAELTARERVGRLVDAGSFYEFGLLSHSDLPAMRDRSPGDGLIGGIARVDGRQAVVIATDRQVLAATEGRVHLRKWQHLHEFAVARGLPFFHLGEGGGLRIPDGMGSDGISQSMMPLNLLRHGRQVPLMTAIVGDSYGGPTWAAVSSDFVTQLQGTTMAAVGPRMLEIATGERVAPETLGGAQIHAEITGQVDHVGSREEECFNALRTFFSYMPQNADQQPPYAAPNDTPDRRLDDVLTMVPTARTRPYDMRRLIATICDQESVFELRPQFGRALITALARLNGHVAGVIANQPRYQAGAAGPDEADKATEFICLCDSYHIPLIFLHDIPGFRVGTAAEYRKMPTKIMVWNQALAWSTVPKISVIIRKSIGAAYSNMAGPGMGADFVVAWPTAEISFTGTEVGINVVYKKALQESSDPEALRQQLVAQWEHEVSPYPAAGKYLIHDVIDPRDTRAFLVRTLDTVWETGGCQSARRLANWPTGF